MIALELSKPKGNESVKEYAFRVLSENILNLTLMPGTAISEKEISDVLSISRTPVREAFIRLSQEGLLEVLPQRGTYVSKIDTRQIAEFRFLRVTLEQAVMKLACKQFPDEFKESLSTCIYEQALCVKNKNYEKFFKLDNMMHKIIFTGCEKPHIWQILQEANLNYIRARVIDISYKQSEIELLFNQHQEIVKAIMESDGAAGYRVITKHINKVVSDVNELQGRYPDLFK